MPRNTHFDDADPRGSAAAPGAGEDDDAERDEDEEELDADADRGDEVDGAESEEEDEDELAERETLEAAAAEAGEDDGDMVPRSRLNEVLERERQLVEKVLDTHVRGAPAAKPEPEQPKFDLKAKRREHTKLLMEGREEEADALADEIDAHILSTATATARAQALEDFRQEHLIAEVNAASATVNREFPMLNPANKKSYDPDLVDEVVALRDVYIRKGTPAGEAIIKASRRVCERAGIEAVEEEPRGNRRAEREEGGDRKQVRSADGKVTTILPKRTAEQVRRAADIAKRIPPRTGAEGLGQRAARRDEEIDPTDMSEAQLAELEQKDPAAFRRLRGDDVVGSRRGR